MDKAGTVFAVFFLALPLLLLLAAIAMGGSVMLAILGVALLLTGFVVALGFVDA